MEITLHIDDDEYQLLQKIAEKISEQVSICEISPEAVATTIMITNLQHFAKIHLE